MFAYQIRVSDDNEDFIVNLSERQLREMMANSMVTGALASMKIEGEDVEDIDIAREVQRCAARIPKNLLTT
jgi:hypothetical protein